MAPTPPEALQGEVPEEPQDESLEETHPFEEVTAMRNEAVHRFLDRVPAEPELRQEIRESYRSDEGDRVETTVRLAAALGFDFSEQEFFQALEERYSGGGELAEEELDQVAGGRVIVGANFLSLVHQSNNAMTFAFPEICETPSPGAACGARPGLLVGHAGTRQEATTESGER